MPGLAPAGRDQTTVLRLSDTADGDHRLVDHRASLPYVRPSPESLPWRRLPPPAAIMARSSGSSTLSGKQHREQNTHRLRPCTRQIIRRNLDRKCPDVLGRSGDRICGHHERLILRQLDRGAVLSDAGS